MPGTLYATLAEYTAWANITASLTTDQEAAITDALDTASRDIEKDTGRRFWLDDTASARAYRPTGRISPDRDGEGFLVDDIGSLTGLVVEIGSGTSWSPMTLDEDFTTEPDNALTRGRPVTLLRRPSSWAWGWETTSRSRVRVTARWGWPAVPAQVKHATLIRAARIYRRKDSPDGIAGSNEFGVVRVSRYDPDYDSLLSGLRVPGFG